MISIIYLMALLALQAQVAQAVGPGIEYLLSHGEHL